MDAHTIQAFLHVAGMTVEQIEVAPTDTMRMTAARLRDVVFDEETFDYF